MNKYNKFARICLLVFFSCGIISTLFHVSRTIKVICKLVIAVLLTMLIVLYCIEKKKKRNKID